MTEEKETTTVNTHQIEPQIKPWRFLQNLSNKLDSLGVETRGIERIQPYERSNNIKDQFISVIGFWISATCGLSTMSTFILGSTLFELEFRQALLCGIIAQFIGCGVAAYCSIMGPKSGCRQMVSARYLFGWWFIKFVSFISVLGVLGWSVVNCVVGGEMLAAISDDKVPLWIGIIIVAILSFLVSIFGIKQLLRAEKYISIPVFIAFLLLYISASDKYDLLNEFSNESVDKLTIKGNFLSFFSLCYSVTSTWGTIASDYYILFPESTPTSQIAALTFFGIGIPSTFVGVLGMILSSLAMTDDGYINEYAVHGMGGVLYQGFSRWNGFGKFCTVILLLSLIANNIINTYSAAFGFQLAGVWLAKIPRWFWAIIITVIYLACALVGRDHFSTILGNFLPMIGYWISIYFILLLEENVIFRRKFLHLYTKEFPITEKPDPASTSTSKSYLRSFFKGKKQNYNWDSWNDDKVLTHGFAAMFSFACGVVGVVVGMAQAYYIGPVAKNYGEYGGDLGMWLSMGFSGVVYPFCRYFELKKCGR